jgi:bla regulator protein blaR1
MKRIAVIAIALISVPMLSAQQPGPAAVEVASIKRTVNGFISGQGAARVGWDPGGLFRVDDGSLSVLLYSAYPDVVDIVGLSGWMVSEHYDVQVKAQREPSASERPLVIRQLLADRFMLSARVEQQDRPTYALKLARADKSLGPNLRPAPVACAEFGKLSADKQSVVPAPASNAPRCGTMVSSARMVSGGMTMSRFADNLSGRAGRVVVDETGLPGDYEITLEFAPDVSVFTAVREQLGLTLESSRGLVPVLVVDRVERPTPD